MRHIMILLEFDNNEDNTYFEYLARAIEQELHCMSPLYERLTIIDTDKHLIKSEGF